MPINLEKEFVESLSWEKIAGSTEVVREPYILEKVVFVGGHPGCGKTMLAPIVGSLDRVEMLKFNYALEHICCLRLLHKIDKDAANAMIRMLTDLDIYHIMMSRESNFRFKDVSSIFRSPKKWRYIQRLFHKGDEATMDRIKKEKPILHIAAHNLLVISPPLFEALGDRINVITVIRHPLYMIIQWYLYVEHYGKNPRDFTIWVGHHGEGAPYWASGWEEKYIRSNTMDKTIYSIEHLSKLEEEVINNIPEKQKDQVLVFPFEYFVMDPWPTMKKIEKLLGTHTTAATKRIMKKHKVPRKMLAECIDMPVYPNKCGWVPPEYATERQELEKRREIAAKLASPEAMKVLDKICAQYEEKYNLTYGLSRG